MIKTTIKNADEQHARGKFVKVSNISELERDFMTHNFDKRNLKIMFFAQFHIDYCGG